MKILVSMIVNPEAGVELDPEEVAKDAKLYAMDFANAYAMGVTSADIQGGWYVVQADAAAAE